MLVRAGHLFMFNSKLQELNNAVVVTSLTIKFTKEQLSGFEVAPFC